MISNEQLIEDFRNGIFALNTRRFGTVAEIMIRRLYGFCYSNAVAYDLYDPRKELKIEVKFSRATKENETRISENNVIEQCLAALSLENRILMSNETDYYSFDSNIQQVKPLCFDYLFYGLFFADHVEIYGIDSADVANIPGFSGRQHYGNDGEGQFHLNESTISFHRDHCFQKELTYIELYNLLNC
ncbi:MAG: hypothetical protein MJ215_07420 [Spirochaetia bacterium]|nr:hypothetical protein [Spirochaetia bacterium]